MRPLRFLQERFGFTRHESAVLLFLCVTLLVGHGVRWYRHSVTVPRDAVRQFDYSSLDSEFNARARTVLRDSTDDTRGQPKSKRDASLPRERIDINRAGEAELLAVPGIGPATARRIVSDRRVHGRFRSVDDLMRIRGIGPKKVERLREYVLAR